MKRLGYFAIIIGVMLVYQIGHAASQKPIHTLLSFTGEPGEYYTNGETFEHSNHDGAWKTDSLVYAELNVKFAHSLDTSSCDGVSLIIGGPNPSGSGMDREPLEVGVYSDAYFDTGFYGNLPVSEERPLFQLTCLTQVCGSNTATFEIHEISRANSGIIENLTVSFEQRCEFLNTPPEQVPKLTGILYLNTYDGGSDGSNGDGSGDGTTTPPTQPVLHALTLVKTGSGGGTISVQDSIVCGAECSKEYDENTNLILTATPDPGSLFMGWSGDCRDLDPTYSIKMDQAKTCTADFLSESQIQNRFTATSAATDPVGLGQTVNWIENDITLVARGYDDKSVEVEVRTYDANWILIFAAANRQPLQVQTYPGARLYPASTTEPGLEVVYNGKRCPALSGGFTVYDVAYGGSGQVERFSASYEQLCEGQTTPLSGTIQFRSTVTARNAGSGGGSSTPTPTTPLTLAVSRAGTGGGSVTSAPAGIDCGTDCDQAFDPNTTVTLTASADANSVFASWGGDCSGTQPGIQVTMDQARSCSATFNDNGDPNRITVSPDSVRASINSEQAVTLTWLNNGAAQVGQTVTAATTVGTVTPLEQATDAQGQATFKLLGATPGQGVLILDAKSIGRQQTVAVEYTAPQRKLTITPTGQGSGTVTSAAVGINCAPNCETSVDEGASVALTATPAADSRFAGWFGDCSGGDANITVSVTQDLVCSAAFEPLATTPGGTSTFALSVSVTGEGLISSEPAGIQCGTTCEASFAAATEIILAAQAKTGHAFSAWSGDCAGQANPAKVTLDTYRSCAAEFAPATSQTLTTLRVDVEGAGQVDGDQGEISCGVSGVKCSLEHYVGAVARLIANPTTDTVFVAWRNDCSGTSPNLLVTLDEDVLCTAVFEPKAADDDGDGSPNVVEALAPNQGDGNFDNLPDRGQSHILSLQGPDSGILTLALGNSACGIERVALVEQASVADTYVYPHGLLDLQFTCAESPLTLWVHRESQVPADAAPRYVHNGQWYDQTATPEVVAQGDRQVLQYRLTLSDNQDGASDGKIRWLGGIGRNGGVFGFSQSEYRIREDAGQATMQVTRVGGSGAVSVDYGFVDETALRDVDYRATTGTLRWGAGDYQDKPLSVPLIDNQVVNQTHAFIVKLRNPAGGAVIAGGQARVVLLDDDVAEATDTTCAADQTTIDNVCTLRGQTLERETHIAAEGHLMEATVAATLDNQGWASNLIVLPAGVVRYGKIGGEVVNQGRMANFDFYGKTLSGGTLAGSIRNETGVIRDVKLEGFARISGGRVGGTISGDANAPATLEQVEVERDTQLSHVEIGAGTRFKDRATLGAGVRFSGWDVVPDNVDLLGAFPALAQAGCGPATASVDLNGHVVAQSPTLIETLNALPGIGDAGLSLGQAATGALTATQDGARFALHPVSLKREPQSITGIGVVDRRITLASADQQTLTTYPAVQDWCVFDDALRAASFPLVEVNDQGGLRIRQEGNQRLWISARPDIAAITANPGNPVPGLAIATHPRNSAWEVFQLWVQTDDGWYRQTLWPEPADPEALSGAAPDWNIDADGMSWFTFNGQTYHGVASYVVESDPNFTGTSLAVTRLGDVNQDGGEDFMIRYPGAEGERQIFYGLPGQ